MNRSITEGCRHTSGTSSSPAAEANAPSLPQANSSALARAGLCGAHAAAAWRAKRAAASLSEGGR